MDHKILIVKEEGDTSQVCQAYDKDAAKGDKRHHRNLLNGIRLQIPIVDCWHLVFVANKVSAIQSDIRMFSCSDTIEVLIIFSLQSQHAAGHEQKQKECMARLP